MAGSNGMDVRGEEEKCERWISRKREREEKKREERKRERERGWAQTKGK